MNFEMSPRANFDKICRTCLTETGSLKNIFDQEMLSEQYILIKEAILSYLPIKVEKNDGLPQQICSQCIYELNRFCAFRMLCENSDRTLRNIKSSSSNDRYFDTGLVQETKKEGIFSNDNKYYNSINIDHNYEKVIKENDRTETIDEDRNKKKDYNCAKCGKIFRGLGEYGKHVSETCFSNVRYRSKENTLRDVKRIHNKTESEAEVKSNRHKAKSIKKQNQSNTCNICNKSFRFHSNLERHKLVHSREKPFLCNVCGRCFSQLSYLKIHSFIHTGEKPYKCTICKKGFAAPGTLMTHTRTHTGEKPHICKICNKRFSQPGYLSSHIRTHTGEKPLECKVCSRKFNQSSCLIIHMRIHSGEKPYTCTYCGRGFSVKNTLTKHIRTHTGERPYVCTICGQAFAQSGTMLTHIKIHRQKQ